MFFCSSWNKQAQQIVFLQFFRVEEEQHHSSSGSSASWTAELYNNEQRCPLLYRFFRVEEEQKNTIVLGVLFFWWGFLETRNNGAVPSFLFCIFLERHHFFERHQTALKNLYNNGFFNWQLYDNGFFNVEEFVVISLLYRCYIAHSFEKKKNHCFSIKNV